MTHPRRGFLTAAATTLASASLAAETSGALAEVGGTEHWTDCEGYGRSDKSRPVNATSPAAPTTWRQRPNTSCSTTAARSDGIASFEDLAKFFALRPNPDKQFIDMPGIAHTSTRSKNFQLVYHLLDAYFGQPGAGAHGLSEAAQRIGPRLRASHCEALRVAGRFTVCDLLPFF